MNAQQLEEKLRALKLFGMAETLEIRLTAAASGELGHIELLACLLEDEAARRDVAGAERRVQRARFGQLRAIEDFNFSYNPKIPAGRVRDLYTLRFVEAGESVILHEPVGVGKSMIAQALGHQACRRGYNVTFTTCSRLLADLAGGHADRSFDARLRRHPRPHLLIVDDFAMREFTLVQSDDLYELITGRQGKASIFTANRQASDWYSLFPNPAAPESILDRVVNASHQIHMGGRSYRPMLRPDRNEVTK